MSQLHFRRLTVAIAHIHGRLEADIATSVGDIQEWPPRNVLRSMGIRNVSNPGYVVYSIYDYLDHSCNKYCDVIGQEEVFISHKYS